MADQLALDFTRRREPELPHGFVRGWLPGSIMPVEGTHSKTPMYPDSALAQVLIGRANLYAADPGAENAGANG